MLNRYSIGDIIEYNPVVTGIIEDDLYCNQCHKDFMKVYITIWNSLFTGIYYDKETAEKNLLDVDKTTLLNYILKNQNTYEFYRSKFNDLLHLLENYYEYINSDDKKKYVESFSSIRLREYLETGDPLKSIIDEFSKVQEKQSNRKLNWGTDELITEEEFEDKNVQVRISSFIDMDIVKILIKEAEEKNEKFRTYINKILREYIKK